MTALEFAAGSAVAMDGSGKLAARSAAVCKEEASTSLAEMVDGGGAFAGVGAVMGAMAAIAAAALAVVVVSGAACAGAVEVLSVEAIAVAPPGFGRRSWSARVRAQVL